MLGSGSRVKGSGFRAQGSRFSGEGFRTQGLGRGVQSSGSTHLIRSGSRSCSSSRTSFRTPRTAPCGRRGAAARAARHQRAAGGRRADDTRRRCGRAGCGRCEPACRSPLPLGTVASYPGGGMGIGWMSTSIGPLDTQTTNRGGG
jgi:hypothetical protein